ncbi:hypothetical protein ACF08N_01295 [Streptomyces sp. NPDC015127]
MTASTPPSIRPRELVGVTQAFDILVEDRALLSGNGPSNTPDAIGHH